MGIPYVTEAVARAISNDVAEQKINSANIPEIEANPTLEGGEAALTALEVNGTKYTVSGGSGGSEVVANPTLEGDEDSLTGLEVDGTKYKVANPKVIYLHDLITNDFSTDFYDSGSGYPNTLALRITKASITQILNYVEQTYYEDITPSGMYLMETKFGIGNIGNTADFINVTLHFAEGSTDPYAVDYVFFDGTNVSTTTVEDDFVISLSAEVLNTLLNFATVPFGYVQLSFSIESETEVSVEKEKDIVSDSTLAEMIANLQFTLEEAGE